MALSVENALAVKQKSIPSSRNPASQSILRTLFSYFAQHLPGKEFQLVPISGLETADVVGADVAASLFAVLVRKPTASTTNAWFKASDNTTTAGTNPDFALKLIGTAGGGLEHCPVFPKGLPFGTGITFGSHTANNGNTKSNAADAPIGFAIVGASL